MQSPEVLDFAKLLAPISKEKPSGEDLRGDASPNSLYYLIKGARTAARNAERQAIPGDQNVSAPDWRPVLEHAKKALAEKTKDLEISAYLIEALVRLNGFAGLRDGFRLAKGLVDTFWDGLYPMPDEEGLSTRVVPLTGLNGEEGDGTLIAPINKVPITDGSAVRLSCASYFQASELSKISDPKVRQAKIDQGAVSPEKFQASVNETPARFFVNLVEDLKAAAEEFKLLGAALDKRCNGQGPPTSQIAHALESCQDLIKQVAGPKLTAPQGEAKSAAGNGQKDGKSAPGEGETKEEPGVGPLRTRQDAFELLKQVVAFFQRTEPQSLVPYALEQVIKWGTMSVPELLTEVIPEEAPRKGLFRLMGIPAPTPPKK
jgi:type VI secretion system protein ImpA